MKRLLLISLMMAGMLSFSSSLYAAVGCTLNDPDRDVQRLFSKSTGYKTEFITIKEVGGDELFSETQKKLGDRFDSVYETIDVPYAYYTILRGKEKIGYIHGVNQKGTYGGMQLILATDLEGNILDFYYQKISSPEAKKFKDKKFTSQFKGLNLSDFYEDTQALQSIQDPSQKSGDDFRSTIRGLKKNLILLDEFKLKDKHQDAYLNKEK